VRFSADNNLGASGQPVTLDGGTLSYVGNVSGGTTITRVMNVGHAGATLDVPNSGFSPTNGKLVINGNDRIVGSASITKTGPGWLTLYVPTATSRATGR